jgi:hypothetical protein
MLTFLFLLKYLEIFRCYNCFFSSISEFFANCETPNTITCEEFKCFAKTHQAVLAPAFSVQEKLRFAAIGPTFWDSLSKRRIQLCPGYNVPLEELMVLVSLRFTRSVYVFMLHFWHIQNIHMCSYAMSAFYPLTI